MLSVRQHFGPRFLNASGVARSHGQADRLSAFVTVRGRRNETGSRRDNHLQFSAKALVAVSILNIAAGALDCQRLSP